MSHQAQRLARALPSRLASRKERVHPDGGFAELRPYLREIGGLETLTVEEEVALARAVDDHSRELRREILGIPLVARLLVGRWCDLRSANHATAALGAQPPDRRPADASARMDDALKRVAMLLDRRDKGHGEDPLSPEELSRIDREMQRILLAADLSPVLLDELARRNLKLVVKVAKEFQGMGVLLFDLVQEGSLGLLHAVGKFDTGAASSSRPMRSGGFGRRSFAPSRARLAPFACPPTSTRAPGADGTDPRVAARVPERTRAGGARLALRPGRGGPAHPPGDRRSARALAGAGPTDRGGCHQEASPSLDAGTATSFTGGPLSRFSLRT